MAPSRIDQETQSNGDAPILTETSQKPTIYLLEEFPAEAVQYAQTLFHTVLPSDKEVKNWRENAPAILVRELEISGDDIKKASKLRAIGKQGTGIDIIDQDACEQRNIPIFNTPGVNAQSVAELVLALTMAVARQLGSITTGQALGKEVRKEHCLGVTLRNKSIGIVGMGAIGKAVAVMFRGAFDCSIYAYDPFLGANAWADIPHTRVTHYEDMLPHVDMLTLHVPLNSTTKGMISWEQLSKMKSNAILINAARGGIVNEDDLLRALQENVIWGAGLDCHNVEPPTAKSASQLWATQKVVSTPHIGATTAETQVSTAKTAIDRVYKFLATKSV